MATLGAQKKHKVTIVGSGNWCVQVYLYTKAWPRAQNMEEHPAAQHV
jgi:hypothetical protein